MPEHKHTKGKAAVINKLVFVNTGNANIPIAACGTGDISDDESQANGNLIAECFNVTNETGKTPRELQVENEKMWDLLSEVKLQIEYLQGKFKVTGTGNSVISRI